MERFKVVKETLSDGSPVFDVINQYHGIRVNAIDEAHALAACEGFNDALDVALGNCNAVPQRGTNTMMLNALQVLVLTPGIRAFLEANDPMALRQARAAIAKAGAA